MASEGGNVMIANRPLKRDGDRYVPAEPDEADVQEGELYTVIVE